MIGNGYRLQVNIPTGIRRVLGCFALFCFIVLLCFVRFWDAHQGY